VLVAWMLVTWMVVAQMLVAQMLVAWMLVARMLVTWVLVAWMLAASIRLALRLAQRGRRWFSRGWSSGCVFGFRLRRGATLNGRLLGGCSGDRRLLRGLFAKRCGRIIALFCLGIRSGGGSGVLVVRVLFVSLGSRGLGLEGGCRTRQGGMLSLGFGPRLRFLGRFGG